MRVVSRVRLVLLVAVLVSVLLGILGAAPVSGNGDALVGGRPSVAPSEAPATVVVPVEGSPTSVVVGVGTSVGWVAEGAGGARVTDFSTACTVEVLSVPSDAAARAWLNLSTGPVAPSTSGTFPIAANAWDDGQLNLSLALAAAGSVSVDLVGPGLPSSPAPVNLTVLPDLDHLLLYDPEVATNFTGATERVNDTYWHVRDRFGDPVPGATLEVELTVGSTQEREYLPVGWENATATGAWVNYSVPVSESGSLSLLDLGHDTLLGPVALPAVVPPTTAATPLLPPVALGAVVLLGGSGAVGIGVLVFGGRPRSRKDGGRDEEEELRRLAEGRATIVEILRRVGPLTVAEVEAAWEPSPAPPAVADWLASLVTDGTLSATLDRDGAARFAILERPVEQPKVTFDEEALAREIARRDRATGSDDGPEDPPPS